MLSLDTHSRGLTRADDEADSPSPAYTMSTTPTTTKSSQHRRSIMSIASLGKLQKLWPSSSSSKSPSSPTSEFKDWSKSDLSAVIRLAGFQMGALGNPANPIPWETRGQDPARDGGIEKGCLEDAAESVAFPPSRAPPPPPSSPRPPHSLHPPYSRPSVPSPDRAPRSPSLHLYSSPPFPSPNRAPPPPPHLLPELSPVNYDDEDEEEHALAVPPARPISIFRRRAKTPVHQIGQLERAAKHSQQGAVGLNRMSSVSTIARQYRELVHHPDVRGDDDDDRQLEASPGFGTHFQTSEEHRRSTSLETPDYHRRCSRLAPSLVSDDGTLVALEEEMVDDAAYCKSCAWSPLAPRPPPNAMEAEADEDEMPAPAALRFSIGLDLLTRELSSAMANQSDASGLQVWVMIEAYERLRHQIAATGPGNEEAKEAIDSWLKALHAIHRDLADEAAMSESEYGD